MTKAFFVLPLLMLATNAQAQTNFSGSAALALAALVGMQSPELSSADKNALTLMLNGDLTFTSSPDAKITIAADAISCRSGNVDLAEHDCKLTFGTETHGTETRGTETRGTETLGKTTHTLKGRAAHELYATLIENGIVPDGAAGSVYAALSHLVCEVKPGEVKDKAGGGASCTAQPGP